MKALDYPLLADENIHPHVIATLRSRGVDVATVADSGLARNRDSDILACAHTGSRVVLTHDRDFGRLAIREGCPFIGIVFLRPGHIRAELVLAMLDAVTTAGVEVEPPFILVAERRENRVHIRFRPTLLLGG